MKAINNYEKWNNNGIKNPNWQDSKQLAFILNACRTDHEEMNLGGLRTNPLMVRGGGWDLGVARPPDCNQGNVLAWSTWLHLAASRKLSYRWIVEISWNMVLIVRFRNRYLNCPWVVKGNVQDIPRHWRLAYGNLRLIIINSKYFPNSDWLKANA